MSSSLRLLSVGRSISDSPGKEKTEFTYLDQGCDLCGGDLNKENNVRNLLTVPCKS